MNGRESRQQGFLQVQAALSPGRAGAPDPQVPPGDPDRRGPAARSLPASPTLNAIALLRALRMRWRLAAAGGVGLAALVGAAAYLLMPPPGYESHALVHVAEKRPRDIFETRESGVSYAIYQRTQAALIRSNRVLEATLEKPEVAALGLIAGRTDPIGWLRERIRTDFGDSEILTISMSGADPAEVATLVNAVTAAYLEQIVEQEEQERIARLGRLEGLFRKYQEELRAKRRDFRARAESAGASGEKGSALRQQMVAEHLGQARRELVQLQSEIRRARAEVTVLTEGRAAAPGPARPATEVGALIEDDPVIVGLRADLAEQAGRLDRISRIARNPNDPSRKQLERAIATLNGALRRRSEEVRASYERVRGPEPARDPELGQARQYLEVLEVQERALSEEIAALDGEMGSLGVQALDLHWLEDEIELSTEVAKAVGTEVRAVTVELEAPPRIKLLEPAKPQGLSDPAERYRRCAMAAVASMGIFAGLVSLLEFRAQRIDVAGEVARSLGIGLIGALPALSRRGWGNEPAVRRRILIESIDAIRTALLRMSRLEPLRVVMITSATKGEGKSSLACHLATSFARAGRRTLLLDGDLRSPSMHHLMDEPLMPGLCEVLRGEVGPDDAIRTISASSLDLLPAGGCDAAAIDALAREELRDLFLVLRGRYEFIIVDTAPALVVTDTLMLSQHVDAALLSVLRYVSRAPGVCEACERLAALGVRLLGAVVAGVRDDNNGYDDSYYNLAGKPR